MATSTPSSLPIISAPPEDAISAVFATGMNEDQVAHFARGRATRSRWMAGALLLTSAVGVNGTLFILDSCFPGLPTIATVLICLIAGALGIVGIASAVQFWSFGRIYRRAVELLVTRSQTVARIQHLAETPASFALYLRSFKAESRDAGRTGVVTVPKAGGYYRELPGYSIKRFLLDAHTILAPIVELTSLTESRWQRQTILSLPAFSGEEWSTIVRHYLTLCSCIIFHYNDDSPSLHEEFRLTRDMARRKPVVFLVPERLRVAGMLATTIHDCFSATVVYYVDSEFTRPLWRTMKLPTEIEGTVRRPHQQTFDAIKLSGPWLCEWIAVAIAQRSSSPECDNRFEATQ